MCGLRENITSMTGLHGWIDCLKMPAPDSHTFYGPRDPIDWGSAWIAALQHMANAAIFVSYPVLIAKAAQLDAVQAADFVAMTLLVMALAGVLQSTGVLARVGSGYLCFPSPTIIFLPASLEAAQRGGLPLLMGMLVFAGLIILALAPVMRRLRPMFPTEVSGLIVLLVGISSGLAGVRMALTEPFQAPHAVLTDPMAASTLVATVTLLAIVALNIWGRRSLSLACVLLGCLLGTLLAAALGAMQSPFDSAIALFHLPRSAFSGWAFDPVLAVPFGIAAVASALKTSGTVLVLQKETQPSWTQADLNNVSAGVLADGLAVVLGGLMGGYPMNTGSGSAGLAIATRVHSQRVAWCFATICLMAAFFPWVGRCLFALPEPVLGAALIFSAAYMMANGIKILTTNPLDSRRTLVVGLSLILGLSVSAVPDMLQAMSTSAQTALGTPMVLGTLSALVINLIFRMGVTRRGRFVFSKDMQDAHLARDTLDEVGKLWGARQAVLERAKFGIAQAIEILRANLKVQGAIACAVSFDDYNVHVRLDWQGPPIQLSVAPPSTDQILQDEHGERLLASYLLHQVADQAHVTHRRQHNRLRLQFDH